MTRAPVALLLAIALPLCGCRADPRSDEAPAPRAAAEWSERDTQALLRTVLAALPQNPPRISPLDVARTRPFVVDVREPSDARAGTIPDAVNVPLVRLPASLQALPPALDADVVVAAASAYPEAIAVMVLRMLGYSHAKALDGGLRAWTAAGLPTTRTPAAARRSGPAAAVNPRLQAALDYYLAHTLPVDGAMSPDALTADQHRKSSAEIEAQPETFDQGRSLLVDVDEPGAFRRAGLSKAINLPLPRLPDALDEMPLQETVNWA